MSEFALINGKVVTPERTFDATVFVKDGKIFDVAEGHVDTPDMEEIDVEGKYILPGAIDVHVHFRTPGGTEKEDWTHGSKSALAGGVTTVLDMPNTNPPTVSQQSLDEKRALVRDDALVNYGFYAGATKDNVTEVAAMQNIAGVKIYMGSSTGNLLVDDIDVVEKFMTDTGHLLVLHAESEACINEHAAEYEGENDPRVHSRIRDPECAEQAVREALERAVKHQHRVHFAHVSTARELELFRKMKKEYITVEVTPHHLFLSTDDYVKYQNMIRVNPPIREAADRDALWQGIADGTVDMVATDHAPHLLEEKQRTYRQAPSGVPGVQTMIPLLLHAVHEGRLTLEKVVELTAANPAAKFGLARKGVIKAGADADLMVVDMNLSEKVDKHFLWTKCHWSPFEDRRLTGWPVMTFVNGTLMYEWRETFHDGHGKEVTYSRD